MVLAFLMPGCANTPNWEQEHLIVAEASGLNTWQLLTYSNNKNGTFTRSYVPPGKENLKSWSERITVGFLNENQISIKQYEEGERNRLNVLCPGTKHQVIEADTYNIYYIYAMPSCGGRYSQAEIGRFIQGNDGLHLLSYVVKGRELTLSEKEKWLSILRNSFLAKGDQHEKVR
jgi:hypothetical protein